MVDLIIYTDGGARGNPGPAGSGAVIYNAKKEVLKTISKSLGVTTNNQAEYWAIIFALEGAQKIVKEKKIKHLSIQLYLDSQLIEQQMLGNYQVKNQGLKPLFVQVQKLIGDLGGNVKFSHVPRRENKEADRLVNEAIDKAQNPKS